MMRYIFLIFIMFFCFSFFSCQKNYEKKIEGTWRFYYLSMQDTGISDLWTFYKNKTLIRVLYSSDTLRFDTAQWEITKPFLEPTFLKIEGLDYNHDGTFQIIKLNKELLILQRIKLSDGNSSGSFKYFEFKRQ